MAQERGVRLTVTGDPFTVVGDAEQLREAMNNVIGNAILYNKPGGTVTISTRQTGGAARIEVVDTGIGIPADAVSRVFERFFRVDKARSREVGGSGLGSFDRPHGVRCARRRHHVHQRGWSRVGFCDLAARGMSDSLTTARSAQAINRQLAMNWQLPIDNRH